MDWGEALLHSFVLVTPILLMAYLMEKSDPNNKGPK